MTSLRFFTCPQPKTGIVLITKFMLISAIILIPVQTFFLPLRLVFSLAV